MQIGKLFFGLISEIADDFEVIKMGKIQACTLKDEHYTNSPPIKPI